MTSLSLHATVCPGSSTDFTSIKNFRNFPEIKIEQCEVTMMQTSPQCYDQSITLHSLPTATPVSSPPAILLPQSLKETPPTRRPILSQGLFICDISRLAEQSSGILESKQSKYGLFNRRIGRYYQRVNTVSTVWCQRE